MTDKYGIPYFANFINSDMNPEDARSMCCRLRLDNRELRKRGGGLFGANPLTGSIGVVTLNLPLYGYLAKGNWEQFISLIDHHMNIARASLQTKRKTLERLTDNGLYPYTKFYLRDIKKRFGKYWMNHFSTIGLVGMNEAIRNFTSDADDITTPFGQNFAKETLNYMRDRIQEFQTEDGDLYNLEATPAEATSYRLARLNKKHYPDIITAGENEPYYTNSTTCRSATPATSSKQSNCRMISRRSIPAAPFSTVIWPKAWTTWPWPKPWCAGFSRISNCRISLLPRPSASVKITNTSRANTSPARSAAGKPWS
jgi:ribonucleoside-triphosphate reductase